MCSKKEGDGKTVKYDKILGYGGFGKIRVYDNPKFGKKVIEKRVGPNFIRVRRLTQLLLMTLIKDYSRFAKKKNLLSCYK